MSSRGLCLAGNISHGAQRQLLLGFRALGFRVLGFRALGFRIRGCEGLGLYGLDRFRVREVSGVLGLLGLGSSAGLRLGALRFWGREL